jgi:tRNA(adenine34) deaminase
LAGSNKEQSHVPSSTWQNSSYKENNANTQLVLLTEKAIDSGNLPIAALLVLEEEVSAGSSNMMIKLRNLLAHAELLTIQTADALVPKLKMAQRQKLILYTTLEPCGMCFHAAMNFNVGRLVYALESPEDGVLSIAYQWRKREHLPYGPCRNYRVPDTVAGVLRAESARLFHVFAERYPDAIYTPWTRRLAALAGIHPQSASIVTSHPAQREVLCN